MEGLLYKLEMHRREVWKL